MLVNFEFARHIWKGSVDTFWRYDILDYRYSSSNGAILRLDCIVAVNISKIELETEYSLKELADIFDYSSQALRKAIKDGELKARRKGKFWLVRGREAVAWWKAD